MDNMPAELISVTQPPQADLTRWQETTEDIILELEHDLRREYYDEKEKEYKSAAGVKPRINEIGLRDIVSEVRSRLNKVCFLSNLDEEDIAGIVFRLNVEILKKLCYNSKEWHVEIVDIIPIANMVVDLVDIGLKKSLNEGERMAITNAQKRIERIVNAPMYEERHGLGDRIKNVFKW
jgi:hypothetical protein